MLTNSIILFLRDLLPVFILFAYMQTLLLEGLTHKSKDSKVEVNISAVLAGLVLTFSLLVFAFYETISDFQDGYGLEWFKILSLFSASILTLIFITKTPIAGQNSASKLIVLGAAVVLLSSTHLSSLLLFLDIYFSSQEAVWQLLIGCAIGLGISFSFFFLFSFLLQELMSANKRWLVQILFSLFLAGQVGVVANLLQQIDILSVGGQALIDLSPWINESAEYGYLLKALFGFEASPTLAYLLVLVLSFSLSCFLLMRAKRHVHKEAYYE